MESKVNIITCDKCGTQLVSDGVQVNGYVSFTDNVSGDKFMLCPSCASICNVMEFCSEKTEDVVVSDGVIIGESSESHYEDATPEQVKNFFTSKEPAFDRTKPQGYIPNRPLSSSCDDCNWYYGEGDMYMVGEPGTTPTPDEIEKVRAALGDEAAERFFAVSEDAERYFAVSDSEPAE